MGAARGFRLPGLSGGHVCDARRQEGLATSRAQETERLRPPFSPCGDPPLPPPRAGVRRWGHWGVLGPWGWGPGNVGGAS